MCRPCRRNATNTVALWPGLAASAVAYVKRLSVPSRLMVPLLLTSVVGGWIGALLLLKTPQHTFQHLVPWLLLGGTLLFTFGNKLRVIAGSRDTIGDLRDLSWLAITVASVAELAVAIYGGYFGAGIGFITLAMLAGLGMHDIHAMGAIRTLLAVAINAARGCHVHRGSRRSVDAVPGDDCRGFARWMVGGALRSESRSCQSAIPGDRNRPGDERIFLPQLALGGRRICPRRKPMSETGIPPLQ
jgi:hypothetical protein